MTTKKIVLIIGGVVGVLALIVAVFAGGITWYVFHTIGSSEAANHARAYLRTNQMLKSDIGEVKDFGSFVTGSINVRNDGGVATLNLKVIGEKRNVDATVDLMYRSNREWRVTGATYDRDGKTVDLMQSYESTPVP